MAKIILQCEKCGGNIILDNAHEIGTCEYCLTQFLIKEEKIIQNITQNTINVINWDIRNFKNNIKLLLEDGYKLLDLNELEKANHKFRQIVMLEPKCWEAWLGYAATGGDRTDYLSPVRAYRDAYNITNNEKEEWDTFIDMLNYLPDADLRSAFVRAFNLASRKERHKIFDLVSGVIGCDESEIASLAIDLCPEDWRAYFAMAKFRQIRVQYCKREGNFLTGKHLPEHAIKVLNIFMKAYRLAKNEDNEAQKRILSYIETMGNDNKYNIFYEELRKQITKER